jgi:hypothetical protein
MYYRTTSRLVEHFPLQTLLSRPPACRRGGGFVWTIEKGGDKAKLVGTPPFTEASVEVQGLKKTNPKEKEDFVRVKVQYTTAKNKMCVATHDITVREPASMTGVAATTPVVGPPKWRYNTFITYTVFDQYGDAIGAGACVDETVIYCAQSHPLTPDFGDGTTDGNGQVGDEFSIDTTDPNGLPSNLCIKLDQDLTAGGCGPVLRNTVVLDKNGATVKVGDCAPNSGCP